MESLFPVLKMCAMVTLLGTLAAGPEPSERCPSQTGDVTIKSQVNAQELSLSASAPADDSLLAGPTGKPWLDDFAGYSNQNSRKQFIVGRSRTISLSAQEAKERACRDAAGQIYPIIRPYIADEFIERQGQRWIVDDLARRLLGGGGYVADRYTDHTDRGYGTLWAHAVLVEVSQPRLTNVAMEYNTMVREREVSAKRTLASIAGLGVLILLTYAGVNAWTKGYCRCWLRAGAVVLMVFVFIWARRVNRGFSHAPMMSHGGDAPGEVGP
jgi:hypothetical protein